MMRRLLTLALLVSLAATPLLAVTEAPEPVDEGSFAGTWFRRALSDRQMVQIRQADDGRYEIRFAWRNDSGFEFDTDWAEVHEFAYKAFPSRITLEPQHERSGDAEIIVHYVREQDGERGTHMVETGELRLYRAREGRHLVWIQDPINMKITVEEPITPREKQGLDQDDTRIWIFRKAANRLLQWDEVPW